MLFETANQFFIALTFLWLGITMGGISEFFCYKIKHNIIKIAVDSIFWTSAGVVFLVWTTIYANASVRLYTIISFFIGVFLEKKLWQEIIAKFKKMIYTICDIKIKTIKNNLQIKKSEKKQRKLKRLRKKAETNNIVKKQQKKKRRIKNDRTKIKSFN